MSVLEDFKKTFTQHGDGLTRIIIVNVIIFLVVNIIDQLIKFTGIGPSLSYWLALPGDVMLALQHVWTFITYMFLHQSFMHILFNMLWLYWMGKIFIEYVGSKRLVGVYLLGGLSGGILYTLVSLVFPLYFYSTFLLGASAGVMAVIVAIALLIPDYMIHLLFLGGVKLKYVALASFVLTSILDFSQNTGGKIAHIGGALFGAIFMIQYKKGNDITAPINRGLGHVLSFFSSNRKLKVSYRRKTNDDDYNVSQRAKQQRIDEILDKISKSGYNALTKEEKDFLFKASGKN